MRFIFLVLALYISQNLFSQDFLGYAHSNAAGIVGASYNPASLADSPYRLDILLVGAGVELGNNYVGVRRRDLRNPNFNSSFLLLRENQFKKAAFFRNEILLPGVMMSNEKFGWGVDLKVRTYANIDGVEPKLAKMLVSEINHTPFFESEMHNRHLGVTMMSWAEIGGTYARTLYAGAEHFLSVGVRGKFLLGLASGYGFLNNAGYVFHNDSTLTIYNAELTYAHSNSIAFDGNDNASYKFRFNPGLGIDVGLVYESRPEVLQKEVPKFRPWPGYRERPAYKYRVGVALCDLGAIRFKAGRYSDAYAIDASRWDINDQVIDSTSPAGLFNTFEVRHIGSSEGDPYWMRLPLALNVNLDYMVRNNIYVNATAFTALYLRGTNGKKVHELTRLSITPRWETRWFGVWAPVSFSRLGNFTLGSGIRLGPLAIGTTNVLPLIFRSKKFYTADMYFVLKVPLFPVKGGKGGKGKTKSGGAVDDCPE